MLLPGFPPAWMIGCGRPANSICPRMAEPSVLALGGYGRGELFPYSDIDLLVCLPESNAPDPEFLAERLFLPLWDCGFDLGHGIRTTAKPSTLRLLTSKFFFPSSKRVFFTVLQDAYLNFRASIKERLFVPLRSKLISWLVERHEERHRRFGDASHLLSPNLKEGRGGQRDLQTTQWLGAICQTEGEAFSFPSSVEQDALSINARFLSLCQNGLAPGQQAQERRPAS
jgi:[protein-PII] uridylyltransferase